MQAAILLLVSLVRLCTKGATHPMSSSQAVHAVPDVLVRNEGALFLFCPLTIQAKSWIDEHVQSDAVWFGSALIVEPRFAWGLAQGMKDAGLVLA
jgi:hypothetical protein